MTLPRGGSITASSKDAVAQAGRPLARPDAQAALSIPKLVLGSASPRRHELLAQLGIVPDRTIASEIDETPHKGELPRDYARRMGREKLAALPSLDNTLLLCADTVVAVGRRILGKPADRDEAAAFLKLLSGRRHKVMTALALSSGARISERLVETTVRFRPLTRVDIDDYLDSGEWQGKAGGYAIQGRAAAFIPWIQGSFSAVVGLPLAETAALLQSHGYRSSI